MLIDFDKEVDKLLQIRQGKIVEGLKLDIPEIDEYFRFKPGNFNVILGHANTGKTTLTLFLMLLYTIKHKTKWLIFSSENDSHTIIKKFIEFLEVKPINKISEDSFNKHCSFIFQYFKIVQADELYSYKQILKLADNVNNAWQYDGLLIDPYNSLVKDVEIIKNINGHEYDYQATSEMRIFCKKTNISIWLTTHAATEALRRRFNIQHEYAGHPMPPMASDVEGGGKFVNRADDFLVVHRFTQHPTEWMNIHLHIRKVKDNDTGGRPTPIDAPIVIKSIKNNVGFDINGKNCINLPLVKQITAPF